MPVQKKINEPASNNGSNSNSSNTKPDKAADGSGTTTSSNKPSVKITQQSYYKEVPRTWNAIPNDKPNCTDYTKTSYHQQWPFNSYIDEREEVLQSLFAQLFPPASIVEDVLNENYVNTIFVSGLTPTIDPVTAAVAKTIFNIGKGKGWWGKKKDDNSDKWNARKPAGCASIAFLQLLYYYKDIMEIGCNYPELGKLSLDYFFDSGKFKKKLNGSYKELTTSDVDNVKSIMEKICKAIPVSIFTEKGTAVLTVFMKKAAENLHLKQFKDPLTNPSNEDAAKYMYQALCNGILPIVYIGKIDTKTELELGSSGSGEPGLSENTGVDTVEASVILGKHRFHYFLVDGCEFNKAIFARSGKYVDACEFYHNDGWGIGSEGAHSVSSMIYDVAKFNQA